MAKNCMKSIKSIYWGQNSGAGIKVFQVVWGKSPPPPKVGRNEKFCWVGNFFTGWLESEEECIWPFKPFSKLKATFCKYWTLTKIKIMMTCVHKKYEVKIQILQKQWLQLKMKIVITWTLLFSEGINLRWEESTGGEFFQVGEDGQIFG